MNNTTFNKHFFVRIPFVVFGLWLIATQFSVAGERSHYSERLLRCTLSIENGNYRGSAALFHRAAGSSKHYRYYVAGVEHTIDEPGGVSAYVFLNRNGGKAGPYAVRVIASDKARDVFFGFFECDRRLPTLALSRQIPQAGFRTLFCGCSSGVPQIRSVRIRERSTLSSGGADQLVWISEQAGQKGDSGGPLISAQGHLIGFVSKASKSATYFSDLEPLITLMRQRGYTWLYLASPTAKGVVSNRPDASRQSHAHQEKTVQLQQKLRQLLRKMQQMQKDLALKRDLGSIYWFRLGFLAREIERVRHELAHLSGR